jgi:hypothetical protein
MMKTCEVSAIMTKTAFFTIGFDIVGRNSE